MGPGSEASVPGWGPGRPRAAAVLSQRVPSSPGAGKAGAAPRARARTTGPGLQLEDRGARGAHGDDRSAASSGVASPRTPPLPSGKRRGARHAGGALRVPRAATHLAARGSHMAGAAAASGTLPGGRARRGARKPESRGPGRGRRELWPRGAPAGGGAAPGLCRGGGGAGTPEPWLCAAAALFQVST